ncbi:MAG TPA: hypothetical protein VFV78_04230 [Vicinamibacterales bacterium]|nr:hypothetical protein [Vicinamibacterales bacterium]
MAQTLAAPIPGIHYFCDHRCWRCKLSDRCGVFGRWMASEERQRAAKGGPTARVASALAVSLQVTMEDASVMLSSGTMAGASIKNGSRSDAAPFPPDDRADRAMRDSLVIHGSDYARASWAVLRGLHVILSRRGDAPSIDAAERLEEMCVTIASKVFRAISSALDPDFDPADDQSDANGSAKVALLLIEESRQAWLVLMQPGRAAADGAPARFVSSLDALETELLRRFPRARDFKRPGFDRPGHKP